MSKAPKEAKPKPVKVGRTTIPIYKLKRHGFQARYYVAGAPKRITRASEEELRSEVEGIATGIENGRVQAGDLSAADVQGYYHAVEELGKMEGKPPPLHVALAEYVSAKALLPQGMTLGDAIRMLLQLRPQAGASVPAATVLKELLASLADSQASALHIRGIRNDLTKWVATLPAGMTLDRISAEDLRAYLRNLKDKRGTLVGPRRRDNVRDEIVSLFRFARSNRYLPEDRQTEAERIKRIKPIHEIRYFTPEQLCTYLVHVDETWLPWMVLGAFAGLRTSEICGEPNDPAHERLRWSDIRWDAGWIIVPKSVAKKIRRPRRVPMKENLKAWLLPWRNAKGYIYPEVCAPTPETIRLAAVTGLPWIKNGLRHTAATHRMAEVGNAGQVAEELGTSVSRIKANYDAVPADIDPKAYYGIQPDAGTVRKIIGFDGNPV